MAAKKPAPKPKPYTGPAYKGASASPKPPAKVTTTDPDGLSAADKAYNKAIDDYTAKRNKAIAAEKKYAADHAKWAKTTQAAHSALIKKLGKAKGEAVWQKQYPKLYQPKQPKQPTDMANWSKYQSAVVKNFNKNKALEQADIKKYGAKKGEQVYQQEYKTKLYKNNPIAPTPTYGKFNTPKPALHQWDLLTGPNRDAFAALKAQFHQYGLDSLAPVIFKYAQQGFSQDTITALLQQTNEYKQRFAANDVRMKNGLPVLSPAEYLNLESSYRSVLQTAGMPKNFYDQHADFANWIGGDVSPTELQNRVQNAVTIAQQSDGAVKKAFGDFYGTKNDQDIAAYMLDPKRATAVIQQQATAAQIAGAATQIGLNSPGKGMAEEAAKKGVSYQQAQNVYSNISGWIHDATRLGEIYETEYGQENAEKAYLLGAGQEVAKTQKLASAERGMFSAQGGGTSIKSLAQGSG